MEVIPNEGSGAAAMRIEAVRRIFPKCWFNDATTEAEWHASIGRLTIRSWGLCDDPRRSPDPRLGWVTVVLLLNTLRGGSALPVKRLRNDGVPALAPPKGQLAQLL